MAADAGDGGRCLHEFCAGLCGAGHSCGSPGRSPITSKTIYSIEDGALCGQTGLQAGDEIVAVNGRRCFVANDILYELVRTEQYRARFTVKRDGQKVELPDVQFDTWQDEDGQTHMSLGFTVYGIKKHRSMC